MWWFVPCIWERTKDDLKMLSKRIPRCLRFLLKRDEREDVNTRIGPHVWEISCPVVQEGPQGFQLSLPERVLWDSGSGTLQFP